LGHGGVFGGRGFATVVDDAGAELSMSDELAALRLAPRRARALLHIATHPYASNREIAASIGIHDDSQVSRLLARMQDLGLVLNHAESDNPGGPNAWQLTTTGQRLLGALEAAALS
jgi:DNA-binding MarR family transcriptional regulator